MARVQIINCDKCNRMIEDGQYHVDAGVYGIDLHSTCFFGLSAFEAVRILSLDEIRFGARDTKGNSEYEKLIYSPAAKQIAHQTAKLKELSPNEVE